MRRNTPKIILPTEPQHIGTTKLGEPIWFDPKDLIPTPDQELEKIANCDRDKRLKIIRAEAFAVCIAASAFFNDSVREMFGRKITGTPEDIAYIDQQGISSFQDGLLTIITVKTKEVRRMAHKVEPKSIRLEVSKEVMRMIKDGGE